MAQPKKKIVLAYSGGLDTSCILKWLLERGYDVVAYIADVGQRDDFDVARERALAVGASEVIVDDLKREFVTDFILPAFSAGATYEGRYLLGTSLARPLIARGQIQAAHRCGATVVSHGATGKGNDQVRFELAYYALDPEIEVFAPWRNQEFLEEFKGRPDLIAYAEKHQIPVPVTRAKPYSEDENLLHISHEGGILEDPAQDATEVLSWIKHPTAAPDKPQKIKLTFKDGLPVKLEDLEVGDEWTEPLALFQQLNVLGAEHGIGLLDMVENRFIGIKSRGVYETPGGTILHLMHQDLEGVAMDREVMRLRNTLAAKLSELVYNGFWFSPEMDFLMGAIERSQEVIDGSVTASLYKGNVLFEGRESPASLYDEKLSSMDIEGGFDQKDSEGFIRINSIRLKAHAAIMKRTTGKSYLPED